ncbi:FkbM family methyltransferase [Aurantimonas sp. DM33-3]|uniref:FkbM family methyltransferase n=1 Tax=Aurantimonas sp. DM33-3 TaxID=2766955 RepID=UPI001651D23D|nr:FkbM family methyltransferase [Aurantimonas sp. DM33-3]MBC6718640.1 FkbM family methyltransferase [Aurantimonas sp. DM33-3]
MKFVSYAQNFEDVILFRALKHVWNGTYVDVGACDPEKDSVTKAFYDRGWSGLNIEPVEAFHKRLSAARPRDLNIHAAAGDVEDNLTCYVIDETGLSTLDKEVAEGHRSEGYEIHETLVPVLPLGTILKDFEARPIHFLKIDVEGFEDNVLAGIDLRRIRPWILVIEATLPSQAIQTHEKWEQRVLSSGYAFAFFDGLSRYYIAEEHADLTPRLAIPANVFDDYELAYSVELREALQKAQESYEALLRRMDQQGEEAAGYAATLQSRIGELNQIVADREMALEDLREEAAKEEHRLHAALHASIEHTARIENSRGWRLILLLRRPLNRVRLLKRGIAAKLGGHSNAAPVRIGAVRSEIKFAAKELARRVALKAARRKS